MPRVASHSQESKDETNHGDFDRVGIAGMSGRPINLQPKNIEQARNLIRYVLEKSVAAGHTKPGTFEILDVKPEHSFGVFKATALIWQPVGKPQRRDAIAIQNFRRWSKGAKVVSKPVAKSTADQGRAA
jgi:hypothetical protein